MHGVERMFRIRAGIYTKNKFRFKLSLVEHVLITIHYIIFILCYFAIIILCKTYNKVPFVNMN